MTSDSKDEASAKVIDRLERGMQFPFLEVNQERSSVAFRKYVEGALRYLKKADTDVARVTFDLIVSGRVQIDEIADLSKHDFLKLRKELVPDGIDLPVSDFLKLHDEDINRTLIIDGVLMIRDAKSPALVREMLQALLANALKQTPTGGNIHVLASVEGGHAAPVSAPAAAGC